MAGDCGSITTSLLSLTESKSLKFLSMYLILPLSGLISLLKSLSRVVFPLPLSPTIQVILFFSM